MTLDQWGFVGAYSTVPIQLTESPESSLGDIWFSIRINELSPFCDCG